MAWFVNLVAAFLTLLAIAFYVVVYTMMLKRTTPQNIVIGGAAGALPPVIGWAAVTGSVALPALILFAIVFYWTPPHFWALSLRIRKDYEAARVPMLPVVRGIPETTRQIVLYSFLLLALSLVLFAVGRMGLIYLDAAVVLGAIFIWQAIRLWQVGSSEEGSTAGAIRLYRYSITYLTLLFAAVAIDALVVDPALGGVRLRSSPAIRRMSAMSASGETGRPRNASSDVARVALAAPPVDRLADRCVPARVAAEPVAAELAQPGSDVGRHDRPEAVVDHVAGRLDELPADRPPRPLGVRARHPGTRS